jgi:hypothetical protein
MAPSVNPSNQFQLYMDQVFARSEILVTKSERGNLRTIEKELNTSLAFFSHVVDYAGRYEISLSEYRDHTLQITKNFEKVKQVLERRQRPLSQRIMDFLLQVAEPIDGFLTKMKIPPLVMPFLYLAQELKDLFESKLKSIAPPKSYPMLPSVAAPLKSTQEPATSSVVNQPQPAYTHQFLPDFVQCIGDCYPQLAKQMDTQKIQGVLNNDPDLASRLLQRGLRSAFLTNGPQSNI